MRKIKDIVNKISSIGFVGLLLFLGMILSTSCHKEENKDLTISLPIVSTFPTEIITDDVEVLKGQGMHLNNKVYVVNSLEDLPEDKFFSVENFRNANIDFTNYSLIIGYDFELGTITSYKYSWSYDDFENRYHLGTFLRIVDNNKEGVEPIIVSYMRSAILVRHIPSDSKVIMNIGVSWDK